MVNCHPTNSLKYTSTRGYVLYRVQICDCYYKLEEGGDEKRHLFNNSCISFIFSIPAIADLPYGKGRVQRIRFYHLIVYNMMNAPPY